MKKIIICMLLMLSSTHLMAQKAVETVYLKNGSIIKGEIVEQVPNQSIKLRTNDGNIFVYQVDEIERITKETQTDANNGKHPGLDFNIEAGYDLPTKSGNDGFPTVELSIGKRFNKSFYWGLGAGVHIPTGSGQKIQIPITTEARAFLPLGNISKVTPFVNVKTGFVLNTADDVTVGKGKNKVTIEKSDFIMFQLMPGVSLPISGCVDLNFGAGYAHFFPVGGDADGAGAIVFRAGLGFHKNSNMHREPVPTRDNGFQMTLEADGILLGDYTSASGNVILGYKLNPNLSFGFGYSLGPYRLGSLKVTEIEYSGFDCQGDVTNVKEYEIDGDITGTLHKVFVRGQYRLNNKRFSPLASLDLGLRKFEFDDDDYDEEGDEDKVKKSSLYIAPAIGFSLRTTNNSYLEMRAGYSLAGSFFEDDSYSHDRARRGSVKTTFKRMSMSGAFITIGWTHTFGSRK